MTSTAPDRIPGRNDPCRCGSGRKYKRCCLEADRLAASERLRIDAAAAKLSDVQAPGFALDAPTPAAADRWLGDAAGVRPDALDGLSLAQYARLLHYEPTVDGLALVDGRPVPDTAVWAEGLVQLAPRLAREPDGEAAFLLRALFDVLPAGEALGMTRSSMLPRATVRAIVAAHAAAFPDSLHAPSGPIATETDFGALHAVRLAAEDAGLLELGDGVLARTPLALGSVERCGLREAFPLLLRSYATVFDWAYLDDGLPEAPSVQDAWLVGLRLVRRHASAGSGTSPGAPGEASGEVPSEVPGIEIGRLARALTAASAEAVHEIGADTNAPDADPRWSGSVEEAVDLATTAFTWRLLVGFAELFGLVTLAEADGGPRLGADGVPRLERLRVLATAQLEDAVRFDPMLLDGPATLFAGGAGAEDGSAVADAAASGEDARGEGVSPEGASCDGAEEGEGAKGGEPEADPEADPEAGPDDASGAAAVEGGRRRRSARAAAAAEQRRRRR